MWRNFNEAIGDNNDDNNAAEPEVGGAGFLRGEGESDDEDEEEEEEEENGENGKHSGEKVD